jgi:hypothetical protein
MSNKTSDKKEVNMDNHIENNNKNIEISDINIKYESFEESKAFDIKTSSTGKKKARLNNCSKLFIPKKIEEDKAHTCSKSSSQHNENGSSNIKDSYTPQIFKTDTKYFNFNR